jgi:alkanesulfonate monooxygenase SsuD/methylene tetrahydromethanopterin reductase-like flavin-dependent oxidoreductase (luciferase family)
LGRRRLLTAAAAATHAQERAMKFGAFFLLGSPGMLPARDVYQRVLDQTAFAESAGFDSVWIAEHHFSNYGYVPNPLMFAVKLAQATTRVRIGTAVLVLPFWDPLRIAEDIAMADQLTDGRLEVGVARGYQPYEFARFGVDFATARERSDETLAVMLAALRGTEVTHAGPTRGIPETTTFPRPLQQPHPPIWLAAATKESFDVAVHHELNGMTTMSGRPIGVLEQNWRNFLQARTDAGLGPPPVFSVQQQVCVTPTDADVRRFLPLYLYQLRQATALRTGREEVREGHARELPFEGEPSPEDLFQERTITGSPGRVRELIERYREVCGMTHMTCVMAPGDMPHEDVIRSMRLFADEVMPHFA